MAFLATTALEEFWDPSQEIVFLSESCRRYSRRAVWGGLRQTLLESPWKSPAEVAAAGELLEDLKERLLPSLARSLNELHGTSHSDRYWRVVLGIWLVEFLHVAYDRYRLIDAALRQRPELTTIGLDESCFMTPRVTNDFQMSVVDDPYNLQLCTRILSALGRDFPRRRRAVGYPASAPPAAGAKARLKRALKGSWRAALEAAQPGRPLVFKTAYFPGSFKLALPARTLGRVWPNDTPGLPEALAERPVDPQARARLRLCGIEGGFGQVLPALIRAEIPRCFVEGYRELSSYADRHYRAAPRAIFSSSGWYCDEAFQHWAAACADRGTRLLGTQHGGYGVHERMIHETHELDITDRYYTWGWERQGRRAATVPFPGTKLIGCGRIGPDNGRSGILYALTVFPRFLLEFPYSPDKFEDYLGRQRDFVAALPAELRRDLRPRPHLQDYGWDISRRWADAFPDVTLESWRRPFRESLAQCRLFVADHISTTYLEALASDKPTLLFWKPEADVSTVRPEARPHFDALRQAGVLHDTPQSAARAAAAAYADVEAWWKEPARRAAVERFARRFARTSPDAEAQWTGELLREAAARPSDGR